MKPLNTLTSAHGHLEVSGQRNIKRNAEPVKRRSKRYIEFALDQCLVRDSGRQLQDFQYIQLLTQSVAMDYFLTWNNAAASFYCFGLHLRHVLYLRQVYKIIKVQIMPQHESTAVDSLSNLLF